MSRSPYDFPQPESPRAERLSALITCWIEIACCKGTVHYPVKLMLRHHPDRPLRAESMPTIPVYLKPVLEGNVMSAKSVEQNRGECVRTSHTARRLNFLRISDERSKTLCFEQLNVTICCRYIESLLNARRINRYLAKHHREDLCRLQNLLDEFERRCQIVTSIYDPR